MPDRNDRSNEDERVHEAYQKLGRRGGEATSETHGREFYEEIGHKGGQKVKELIEAGKKRGGGGTPSGEGGSSE